MLPVVDKPAIQYVVEEAVAAGLDDVLMITGRNKSALEDHFDRNSELETVLEAKGDERPAGSGCASRPTSPTCTTCARASRWASGHAVLRGQEHVGDEPVRRAARRRPHRQRVTRCSTR